MNTTAIRTDAQLEARTRPQTRLDTAVAAFESTGYLEIENAFDAGFVAALRTAFEAGPGSRTPEAMAQDKTIKQVGHRRFLSCLEMAPPFNDPRLYANPFVLQFMERLLGPGFVINSFNCVCAYPGAEDQHRHRDHPPLFQAPELHPQLDCYAIQLSLPLIDLSPEVGTTAMLPGTHKLPARTRFEGLPEELPYPRLGSCCVMDYRLSHHGTANVSNRMRPILYMVYSRPWFVDMLNFRPEPAIRMRPAEIAAVPPEHLGLFQRVAQGLCDQAWWLGDAPA